MQPKIVSQVLMDVFFNPKTLGVIIFSPRTKKDANLIHKFQEKIPQKSDFTAQSQKIY